MKKNGPPLKVIRRSFKMTLVRSKISHFSSVVRVPHFSSLAARGFSIKRRISSNESWMSKCWAILKPLYNLPISFLNESKIFPKSISVKSNKYYSQTVRQGSHRNRHKNQWLWLRNAENSAFWGNIFAARWQKCFQFSNITKHLDQKMKFHDFSVILAIFPQIHDFSRPGQCIFKFHDFSWPYEPCRLQKLRNKTILFLS